MKRRDFLAGGTAGAFLFGAGSCAKKEFKFKTGPAQFSFKATTPRPVGKMTYGEIGKTGIKVSRLCFGSHISQEVVKNFKERQKVIRESYDLGVNFFDVYDLDSECYQYGPMGKHLAPMINDVVISVSYNPPAGLTPDQEIARILKLFGRDHIDMIRVHRNYDDPLWDKFFEWKEKGYVRAVGKGTHDLVGLDTFLDNVPLDFILFPYNFYHNKAWLGGKQDNFDPLPVKLRKKGIGVLTMKPFAGEYLVTPFLKTAKNIYGDEGAIFPKAALRYILNSGVNPDSVFAGMYCMNDLYQDIDAFYNPGISDREKDLLGKITEIADRSAAGWLPEHYRWLCKWTAGNKNAKG